MTVQGLSAPLCDAGRCAQVMAAFAKIRDGFVARQAEHLTQVCGAVLRRHGLDITDPAIRAEIAAEIEALTGTSAPAIEGMAK